MDSFFSPAGCAVVGASRDPQKPGHQMLRSMLDAGFPPERLFPVNPGLLSAGPGGPGPEGGVAGNGLAQGAGDEIAGLRAYPDLASIPGVVELAVVMVPPRALDDVLADVARRAASRRDLKALIVTAGGYAELGTAEGRERQARLARAAREAGVRLMGPNCIGVIDTRSRVDTTFLHGVVRRSGPLGFVSQSGALGAWFLQMLSSEPEPVGFGKFVSLGNMADVTMAETLDYLRTDLATGVVGLYLEGVADPRPLLASIAALSADKPVVVLKTGRTESGRAAATSHTGALAGTDRVWDGALRQAGALRVDRMEEFVDTLRVLAGRVGPAGAAGAAGSPRMPALPRPPLKVFLVTHAGGPGVYAMDLLAAHPRYLTPAGVTPDTKAALAAAVPPMSSVCRPEGHLDMTASATPAQHAEVVKLLLGDPGVDALVTLDLPIRFLGEEAVAEALAGAWREAAGARLGKVFLPLLMHGKWSESGRGLLERAGLCALETPDRAVAVLVNLARQAEFEAAAGPKTAASREDFRLTAPPAATLARADGVAGPEALPAGRGVTLNEVESAALLAAAGVEFAPSRLAVSRDEVFAAAEALGYPVVLKLCSRDIPHKVAVGALRLGLAKAEDLARAYDELAARARELPARLDGFVVQAQAHPGTEVIVGGLRDPLFGPVVAAGLGGIRVGLDAPLLFRLAPLSPAGALGLAGDVAGATGDLDLASLAKAILGMSRLMSSRFDVAEADLNPIILYPRGRGAVAVDALVRLAGED